MILTPSVIKYAVIAVALSASLFLGYKYIYNIGYDSAKLEYELRIKEYEDKVVARIDTIELNSFVLLEQNQKNKLAAAKDFKSILDAAKNKPTYILDSSGCKPSPELVDTLNQAINRANKK
jgi:hypothetical protein